MTIAHVEKFAELVGQNPDLYAKFGWEKMAEVGVKDMPAKVEWMASAVNEGKAHGLNFTAEEALTFLSKSFTDATSGELSDLQLEAVAGGKSASSVGQAVVQQTPQWQVLNAISPAAGNWTSNAVATIFSGW
jgi:hypothetical protein